MSKLIVVDSMPGQGKTSYALQFINNDINSGFGDIEPEFRMTYKYIFVTPYLSEVSRIKKGTSNVLLDTNDEKVTKYDKFLKLLEEEKSVVITHKLFEMFDERAIKLIESKLYILIIDESPKIIDELKISKNDIKILMDSNTITIGEKGLVTWVNNKYSNNSINRFNDIHSLIKYNTVYANNNYSKLYQLFNVDIFSKFEKVYILTYLFDGQNMKYLLDFQNIEYIKKSVAKINQKYELINYDINSEPRKEIKEKLIIYEDITNNTGRPNTLNNNFNKRRINENSLLNKTWFDDATDEELTAIRNNLNNYFKKKVKTKNDHLYWTTLKDKANILAGEKCKYIVDDKKKNYEINKIKRGNFVSLGIRATNDYAHCTSMAYIYNRFMNPYESNFFKQHSINVNEDVYATSELIQFIFRGCIRNNEPMNCYIPSLRMRTLLYDWMEFKL